MKINAVGIPRIASKLGVAIDIRSSDEFGSNTTPQRLVRTLANIIYAQLEFRMVWQHALVAER